MDTMLELELELELELYLEQNRKARQQGERNENVSSTSFTIHPGENLVDGLPPAASAKHVLAYESG